MLGPLGITITEVNFLNRLACKVLEYFRQRINGNLNWLRVLSEFRAEGPLQGFRHPNFLTFMAR
jgi:hypothetical protein